MRELMDRNELRNLFKKAQADAQAAQVVQNIDAKNAIIIVDKSYCIYHAMFSAWAYVKSEFGLEKDPNYDPTCSADFREYFSKKLRGVISYAAKIALGGFPDLSKVIFCSDCSKEDIWRTKIYKEYKLTRRLAPKEGKPFDFRPVFRYVEDILIPTFLEENKGSINIRVPNAEGDDIAASVIKLLPEDRLKVLVASDKDYMQLAEVPNLKIVTGFGKILTLEDESKAKALVDSGHILTAKEFLIRKILIGDKADNIDSIIPRLGEGKAAKYILEKDKLKKLLEDDPEAKARFQFNARLIDFRYIPKVIVEDVKGQIAEFLD